MKGIAKNWNRETGATLVEVLVALALIALVTVSLTAIMTQSAVFSKNIDQVYSASRIAQMRLELLKMFDFDQIYPGAVETNIRVSSDGTIDANGDFIRSTEVFTGTNPFLIRIKVAVDRIVDGSPSGHPVAMETCFADID